MHRASAAMVLSLIVASPAVAQNAKQMQPTVPSPTAASLGKFGDVPIGYYTGLPQISIPLFTVKGKTLELPISLDYHASGIKVEEIGGWVGMGWALEAGGVITRTVRGIADERYEGYWNTGHVFYEPQNQTFPPPVQLVANIYNEVQDGEPDQFFFNFAGQSGEFVGGDTSSIQSTPNVFVTIPYRKWRLQPLLGNEPYFGYGTIMGWIVTTEDGTKYTFGAAEITLDRNRQYQTSSGLYSYPYASSWYLTEIRSSGGDVVTLTYADYQAEHHLGLFREEVNDTYESEPGACGLSGYQEGGSTIRDLHSQSYHHAKRLMTITSAAHTITFHHSLRDDARSPLLDDPGAWGPSITNRIQQEPRLDSLTVRTPEGVFLKRFEFAYTYGGPLNGRLTLLNVFEKDSVGNRLPPYSFTYDFASDGSALPPRMTDRTDYHDGTPPSASFALDAWGYYNGAPNASPIPPGTAELTGHSYPGANRTPNFAFMKTGSLIKITYPTGGFNEFVYEPNDFSSGASLIQDAPEHHDASVVSSPGDVSPSSTDFVYAGGVDPTLSSTIDVYMSGSCSPQPCIAELWRGPTRETGWSSNQTAYHWTLTRDVTYTIKAWNNATPNIRVAVSVHWDQRILLTKKTAGGLRIKEVRANDGMSNVTVRKYSYQYDDGRSTGWITLGPRFDFDRNLISGDQTRQCVYYSRSSTPQNPLGNGLQVTYAQVTESLGVNGVFGVVRRRFEAGCDCANAEIAARHNSTAPAYNSEWPFLRYTMDAWRRGQLLSTEELSATGAMQRATSLSYGNPPSLHPTITFRGLAVDVYSMISRWYGPWPITTTYFIWASPFQVQTALKVQTAQATTFYDTTGTSSFGTTQQFKYGNPGHAQLTEITETNSDNTQRITRMKYPGDYATDGAAGTEAGALAAMQDVSLTGAHMPGVVIERSVSSKVGPTEQIVQAEITTFKEFLAGQFLPYKHYVLNSPSPIQ